MWILSIVLALWLPGSAVASPEHFAASSAASPLEILDIPDPGGDARDRRIKRQLHDWIATYEELGSVPCLVWGVLDATIREILVSVYGRDGAEALDDATGVASTPCAARHVLDHQVR